MAAPRSSAQRLSAARTSKESSCWCVDRGYATPKGPWITTGAWNARVARPLGRAVAGVRLTRTDGKRNSATKLSALNPIELLYWSYFTFYRSVMKDNTPHLLTTLAVSTSEAMLVIPLCDYAAARFFCLGISKPAMFTMIGVSLLLNYWYFHSRGHALRIVQIPVEQAQRVHLLSAAFFISSLAAFIEVPGIVHELLQKCH